MDGSPPKARSGHPNPQVIALAWLVAALIGLVATRLLSTGGEMAAQEPKPAAQKAVQKAKTERADAEKKLEKAVAEKAKQAARLAELMERLKAAKVQNKNLEGALRKLKQIELDVKQVKNAFKARFKPKIEPKKLIQRGKAKAKLLLVKVKQAKLHAVKILAKDVAKKAAVAVRFRGPIVLGGRVLGLAGRAGAQGQDDTGRNLLLPESTDLNRILERATEFFAAEPPKWEDGIDVIQQLLEGNSQVEVGPDHLNDPHYSVYSRDDRLFIPFSQYCQKLICSLPLEGIEAYRSINDGKAARAFAKAKEELDMPALEALAGLYFATSSGAEIVMLLADVNALHGDVPKAIYLRNRLLEEYPDLDEELYRTLLLRQAHAFAMTGQEDKLEETLTLLVSRDSKAAYTVSGVAVPVERLLDHEAFRLRKLKNRITDARNAQTPGSQSGFSSVRLHPLWMRDFASKDPYGLRTANKNNVNRGFWRGNRGGTYMPSHKSFLPGVLSTTFAGPGGRRWLAVKDHEKLTILDLLSGIMVSRDRANNHKNFYKAPGRNYQSFRVRLPSTDYLQQRLRLIGGKLYGTVETSAVSSNTANFPFRNKLIRYDPVSDEYETRPHVSKNRLFFQGPPVSYGKWLFAPVRKKRSFCLAKLDAETMKLDSVVTVHTGGTILTRVPSVSPVRVGHQLIHLTNAGAVASFSLPDLELRWLRRYEKRTPHHSFSGSRRTRRGRSYYVQSEKLKHWKPLDPIVLQGRVLIAPIDSDALLCLDQHTGAVLWTLPRLEKPKSGGRHVNFHDIIGVSDDKIFLVGNRLQCVNVLSGKRLWEVTLDDGSLPGGIGGKVGGRGTLAGKHVYLPFEEGVGRFSVDDGSFDGLMKLAPAHAGKKKISYPYNLQVDGPMLIAISDSQIATFTVPEDLVNATKGGLAQAESLLACDRVPEACRHIRKLFSQGQLEEDELKKMRSLYVRLSGELAMKKKSNKDYKGGLEIVDRCEETLNEVGFKFDPTLILFRIQLFQGMENNKKVRALREELATRELLSDDVFARKKR